MIISKGQLIIFKNTLTVCVNRANLLYFEHNQHIHCKINTLTNIQSFVYMFCAGLFKILFIFSPGFDSLQ